MSDRAVHGEVPRLKGGHIRQQEGSPEIKVNSTIGWNKDAVGVWGSDGALAVSINAHGDHDILGFSWTGVDESQEKYWLSALDKIYDPQIFNVEAGAGSDPEALNGSVGRFPIRLVRANSCECCNSSGSERPYLDDVRETRLRVLIGIPLLLFGIWLSHYIDRTFDGDLGWRGWSCFVAGALCFVCSFVLLFYGSSLSTLL